MRRLFFLVSCALFASPAAAEALDEPAATETSAIDFSLAPAAIEIEEPTGGRTSDIVTLPPVPESGPSSSTTIFFSFESQYPFQDMGIKGTDEPVLQGGVSHTRGHWTFGIWQSIELSDDGEYGDRGFGDEWDLNVDYAGSTPSPIGRLNYQLGASYYAFANLGDSDDDMVELRAEVSRPIDVGSGVTVTPYVRVIRLIGTTEVMPDLTFVRPGVRVNVPVTSDFSLSFEGARAFDVGNGTAVWRTTTRADYSLGGGWSVNAGVKTVTGVSATPFFGAAFTW